MGSSSEKRTADGPNVGEWLVNVSDDVVVPMTTLEVIDGLRAGRLSEQSLVWRIGMHNWTPIVDVPQLRLAAGSRFPPPAAARASQPPFAAQAEARRRRDTLPLGFPGVKDSASVTQPAGFSSPPESAPVSAPLAGPEAPLAVYERPAASLTFSASARVDWQGNVDSGRLTPVPSVAAPLTQQPTLQAMPNSLAPTTAEADADRTRAPGAWADLDELLSSERRADQKSSRRVVLWAAVGSATLAAVFALLLLRSPAPQGSEPAAAQAAPASDAPLLAPTLESLAAPSASESPRAPAAARVAPQAAPPRFSRRPKRGAPAASASATSADLPATTDTRGPADVAVVPLAPLEPAPAVSTSPEAAPTSVASSAPLTPASSASP